ncbi:MAG TPA: oxidoreductase [Mycobacteriales bacterium]|nr:oxidoreductase [Mycobacteriales bacterium]
MFPSGSRPAAWAPSGARPDDPLLPLLGLPGVTAAVAAARESVDELLGHRVLRRHSAAVTAESALRGARASAALDGVNVPLPQLRTGAAGDDPVVRGALRVSAGVGELVDTWARAPLQVLARLHVLAAAGAAGSESLGRPSGRPDNTARLDALGRLVAGDTAVPAIVLAAVVHGELRTLAPFGSADGLVARAAARLTMISRGLDPKSITVPEVGHLELRAEYEAALASYRTGTPDGVASWLRHCCTAVELGAREALAICEAVRRR